MTFISHIQIKVMICHSDIKITLLCFINFLYKALTHIAIAPCTGDITCGNGCCRNNPCLNGGTALKSVSPRVLGTTVPVQSRLLGNIARLDWEVVRITKQLGITHLDCTQSLMVAIKFSECSAILIQKLSSLGT